LGLTVESCMKLPSFRCAEVIAGHGGLGQPVNSITVLEYSDASVILPELFLNHEMCITAFSLAKDDVGSQCAIVRRMKEVGVSALVLYYVGIFIPYLDEELLKTADEVNLPLICMPHNRFDLRYGEAINDVMYAIFRNNRENHNFIPEVLESISELPERHRTIRSLLQIISDRFHCSFFLINKNGELVSEGQWPWAAGWNYQPIADYFLSEENPEAVLIQQQMELDQKDIFVTHADVLSERSPKMHLFAIDEQNSITYEQVSQAAELISLFMSISNYTAEETTPEMIIRCIITNEQWRIREIAAKHRIDIGKLQKMWVIGGVQNGNDQEQKRTLQRVLSEVKKGFQKRDKWVLADLYHDFIIVLFQGAAFAEFDEALEAELVNRLAAGEHHLRLIKCMNIASVQSIQEAYHLIESYFNTVQLIYPNRQVFDLYDLHFAERLKTLVDEGGAHIAGQMYALQPLRKHANHRVLMETLTVYLLDADENLIQTAEILGLHKNTVRYRLKQIRDSYDRDITGMPLASELYKAVALQRLSREN